MPNNKLKLLPKLLLYFSLSSFVIILLFLVIIFLNPSKLLSNPLLLTIILSLIWLIICALLFFLIKREFKPLEKIQKTLAALNPNETADKTQNELASIATTLETEVTNFQNSYRKLAQQKDSFLRDRAILASTLSNTTNGIIGVDPQRRIIIFNKACQNLTGLKESDVLGKQIKEVLKVFNKDGEISELIYCPVGSTNENSVLFSEKNIKILPIQNKKESTVDLSTTGVRDSQLSSQLNCVITIKDITQSKELEDMKFDFVSMAAHELRTPLTTIKGYLSVFMQENKDKLNADQKMLLGNIASSSERLSALVENLLSVSRIERGGLVINMQQIDWMELVKTIIGDHLPRAKEKQIDLHFTPPSYPIPQVHADKIRIGEVISNLISNAIKYTEPQGKITVSVESNGKEVITHVSDTGHGIPQASLPYMFNKFYRVNSKLELTSKGNGLGLYITKSIIELHHGKIWVRSTEGEGSTFSFSIPL